MAEELNVGVTVPRRTEERLDLLADLSIEVLIERAKAKTITAAELTTAFNYLKNAGIKPIVNDKTKAGELVKALPTFDLVEEILDDQGRIAR
jgi:hypothetical protein